MKHSVYLPFGQMACTEWLMALMQNWHFALYLLFSCVCIQNQWINDLFCVEFKSASVPEPVWSFKLLFLKVDIYILSSFFYLTSIHTIYGDIRHILFIPSMFDGNNDNRYFVNCTKICSECSVTHYMNGHFYCVWPHNSPWYNRHGWLDVQNQLSI